MSPLLKKFTFSPRGNPPVIGRLGIECQGRMYGSWIGSRNGHALGDLISPIPYFIESILREELGVVTADIDTDSFDAAPQYTGRLNLTSDFSMSSRNLIEMLAFQNSSMLSINAGIYSLTDLTVLTPPIAANLRWTDLAAAPTITRTPINAIINKLTINHNFAPEHNSYFTKTVFSNAVSDTRYGELIGSLDAPFMTSQSDINELGNLLVPSSGIGFWSSRHNLITVPTNGWRFAHLNVGEWITLDDTTVAPFITIFGGDWDLSKLLIIAKTIRRESVWFDTLELIT